MAVTQTLGPIHGELLKINIAFDVSEKEYKKFEYYSTTWEQILYSHRVFLIDQELKEDLETFFNDIFEYNSSSLDDNIRNITSRALEPLLGESKLSGWPGFMIESGRVPEGDFRGIVFWKVHPEVQSGGTLRKVEVGHRAPSGTSPPKIFDGDRLDEFVTIHLPAIWKESDKDVMMIEARKTHERLHSDVMRLKEIVEKKIKEWAK
ncbi:MAG: hypothetical protein V3U49_01245 [Nitrososphaerales archaeon]